MFGISEYGVSKIINNFLPIITKYFLSYIPNHQIFNNNSSNLDPKIKYVIDGTITEIRRPKIDQKRFWRKDKQLHFIQVIFYLKLILFNLI